MIEDGIKKRGAQEYDPPVGSNIAQLQGEGITFEVEPTTGEEVRSLLNILLEEVRGFRELLDLFLSNFSAPLTEEAHPNVWAAHAQEWPSHRGSPPYEISYSYYKALFWRTTSAAAMIRKRFEQTARGLGGTNALDFSILNDIVEHEALLIEEFFNDHLRDIDDSSEQRIIDHFRIWLEAAIERTREFRNVFQEGAQGIGGFPPGEIESLSPEEAVQGQAVFTVKLNAHNRLIVRDIDSLKKNFAEYSDIFYHKFLAPAVDFRLDISRKVLPFGTSIAREIDAATRMLDNSLRETLADQVRRIDMFSAKMSSLSENIRQRDLYRTYVAQLSQVGLQGEEGLVEHEDSEEVDPSELETEEDLEEVISQLRDTVTDLLERVEQLEAS